MAHADNLSLLIIKGNGDVVRIPGSLKFFWLKITSVIAEERTKQRYEEVVNLCWIRCLHCLGFSNICVNFKIRVVCWDFVLHGVESCSGTGQVLFPGTALGGANNLMINQTLMLDKNCIKR